MLGLRPVHSALMARFLQRRVVTMLFLGLPVILLILLLAKRFEIGATRT